MRFQYVFSGVWCENEGFTSQQYQSLDSFVACT